jgi:hypothetical protein
MNEFQDMSVGSVVPPTGRIHTTGKANQEIVINPLINSPPMRLLEVVLPVGFWNSRSVGQRFLLVLVTKNINTLLAFYIHIAISPSHRCTRRRDSTALFSHCSPFLPPPQLPGTLPGTTANDVVVLGGDDEMLDVLPTFVDDAEPLLPDINLLDFLLTTAFGSLGRNKKSIPECHMCPGWVFGGES